MITKTKKAKIIDETKVDKKDTGSADVQIAVLSERIKEVLSHLKKNPKDVHSKRGLLKMVIKRKKLLKYLERKDQKRYKAIVKKVGLKEKK